MRGRRPVVSRRGRLRPTLPAVVVALETAALERATDGLILDRATAPADRTRLTVLFAAPALTLDLGLDHATREAAHGALCHGWKAGELLDFARSRFDGLTVDYLADVLGLTAQWSAAAGWLAELDGLGVRQWWTSGDAHAAQFALRHEVDRARLIDVGVDVLALLSHLPCTEAALPETPDASGAVAGTLVGDRRIVARIDGLFARAVGTTFTHEAEACAAKAQDLLLRYARPVFGQPRRPVPAPVHRRRPQPVPLAISA